jgi:ribose transport system substrate-binding protein
MTETSQSSLPRRTVLKAGAAFGVALAANAVSRVPSARADDAPLSLAGKKIAISATGTDHYWDLKAYQAQIDEVKRLGG